MNNMTANPQRSQLMRNFGIREADLASLGITTTEEINPSVINTKWGSAVMQAVMLAVPVGRFQLRAEAAIEATHARDRLLRTMEMFGHIPRLEPPVIQAAPAPTPDNSSAPSGSCGPSGSCAPSSSCQTKTASYICEKPTDGTANPQEWGTIQKASKAGEDSR